MKRGFTLIELLVVVLIIGILSSVALPQYTKAVRKARISEAQINLKNLVTATDMYILSNGTSEGIFTGEPADFSNLDIDVPTQTKNWNYYIDECIPGSNGKTGCWIEADPLFETGYSISFVSNNYDGEGYQKGKYICRGYSDSGKEICKSLGKKIDDDYWVF